MTSASQPRMVAKPGARTVTLHVQGGWEEGGRQQVRVSQAQASTCLYHMHACMLMLALHRL